jgi:hypothetical protein
MGAVEGIFVLIHAGLTISLAFANFIALIVCCTAMTDFVEVPQFF